MCINSIRIHIFQLKIAHRRIRAGDIAIQSTTFGILTREIQAARGMGWGSGETMTEPLHNVCPVCHRETLTKQPDPSGGYGTESTVPLVADRYLCANKDCLRGALWNHERERFEPYPRE